jgi:hypothetical protein
VDIHTAEQLVSEPSLVEMEIATGKLKSYKLSGTDQILAELIKHLLLYQFIKRVIIHGNNY